jgi:outer membrane lipoprotein SlyB
MKISIIFWRLTMNSSNQYKKLKSYSIAFVVASILSGCAATGANLQANVYKAGQVNTAQNAKAIKIIAVLPAQIEVDNSKQRQTAQIAGGILGAVAGGLAGGFGKIGSAGTAGTTVAGGAIGAAAGSMISDKVLVEGVSISYSENENIFNSAQVGRDCEYRPGSAIMISTAENETRIQPNAVCPVAVN